MMCAYVCDCCSSVSLLVTGWRECAPDATVRCDECAANLIPVPHTLADGRVVQAHSPRHARYLGLDLLRDDK